MIRAILACDARGGIARNGIMPWPRNKKDLQHFSKLTRDQIVVMGRGTWEAEDMPTPLPNRVNAIVSSNPKLHAADSGIDFQIVDEVADNLHNLDDTNPDIDVFVIGGAKLFTSVIDEIEILHLTRIAGNFDCDTFIPLDLIKEKFDLIDRISIDAATTFETYIARKI